MGNNKVTLLSICLPILDQYSPRVTNFFSDECQTCSPNEDGDSEMVRHCLWFEANTDGVCERKLSSSNSHKCGNIELTKPCPLNGESPHHIRKSFRHDHSTF